MPRRLLFRHIAGAVMFITLDKHFKDFRANFPSLRCACPVGTPFIPALGPASSGPRGRAVLVRPSDV